MLLFNNLKFGAGREYSIMSFLLVSFQFSFANFFWHYINTSEITSYKICKKKYLNDILKKCNFFCLSFLDEFLLFIDFGKIMAHSH